MLPVKFHWIPFSSFREEVENVSANQRPGQPSCFSDQHDKHRTVEDIEILLPVMFLLIPFNGGDVENVSSNQRLRWPSYLSDRPKKHKLGRGHWDNASCQVSLNFSAVAEKKLKIISANQRPGRPSCFLRLAWKDTSLGSQQKVQRTFTNVKHALKKVRYTHGSSTIRLTHVFYHTLYVRFEKHAFNTWYEKHEFTIPWKTLWLHITTHALKLFFSRRTFYARSGMFYYTNYTVCASVFIHFCMQRKNN